MLSHHGGVEPQARSRPSSEADDAQVVGVRVDPAALDVEASGDLAGGQHSARAGLVIATEQLSDLTRDRARLEWSSTDSADTAISQLQPVLAFRSAIERLHVRAPCAGSGFQRGEGACGGSAS